MNKTFYLLLLSSIGLLLSNTIHYGYLSLYKLKKIKQPKMSIINLNFIFLLICWVGLFIAILNLNYNSKHMYYLSSSILIILLTTTIMWYKDLQFLNKINKTPYIFKVDELTLGNMFGWLLLGYSLSNFKLYGIIIGIFMSFISNFILPQYRKFYIVDNPGYLLLFLGWLFFAFSSLKFNSNPIPNSNLNIERNTY